MKKEEQPLFTSYESPETSLSRFMDKMLDKHGVEPAPLRRCGLTKERVKQLMESAHITYLTSKQEKNS